MINFYAFKTLPLEGNEWLAHTLSTLTLGNNAPHIYTEYD
jgi:hypothetical protein